jgi:ribosomal protein S18 acetylase RimI-like enzyme
VTGVLIRTATAEDWAGIWPFFHQIVAAGETYAFPPDMSSDDAEQLWMRGSVFVAVADDGVVVGSGRVVPNYGPASIVANASYMVGPARAGLGIGRRLVEYSLDLARAEGFEAMVFNAVVETNVHAVHLYESMGFRIIGTVPEGFVHPTKGRVALHIMHIPLLHSSS